MWWRNVKKCDTFISWKTCRIQAIRWWFLIMKCFMCDIHHLANSSWCLRQILGATIVFYLLYIPICSDALSCLWSNCKLTTNLCVTLVYHHGTYQKTVHQNSDPDSSMITMLDQTVVYAISLFGLQCNWLHFTVKSMIKCGITVPYHSFCKNTENSVYSSLKLCVLENERIRDSVNSQMV